MLVLVNTSLFFTSEPKEIKDLSTKIRSIYNYLFAVIYTAFSIVNECFYVT